MVVVEQAEVVILVMLKVVGGLDGKRDDECDDQGLWGSGYCSSGWYIGMNWYDVLDHCGGSCAERKKERGRQRGTPEERTGLLLLVSDRRML